MRFHELLLLVNFDEVVNIIINIYYSNDENKDIIRKNYLEFLNNLINNYTPELNNTTICIDYIPMVIYEDYTEDAYWHVYGIEPNKKDTKLALEFSSFSIWLGFYIDENIFINLNQAEVIAHCIWEMTFISFDENEIIKKIEEISSHINEIMEEIQ